MVGASPHETVAVPAADDLDVVLPCVHHSKRLSRDVDSNTTATFARCQTNAQSRRSCPAGRLFALFFSVVDDGFSTDIGASSGREQQRSRCSRLHTRRPNPEGDRV